MKLTRVPLKDACFSYGTQPLEKHFKTYNLLSSGFGHDNLTDTYKVIVLITSELKLSQHITF
ncbi:hypothetical protein CR513_37282, partial [Mucuna pruriens]